MAAAVRRESRQRPVGAFQAKTERTLIRLTAENETVARGYSGRVRHSSGQAPGRPVPVRQASGAASGDDLILGCEPNERALRLGLERGYRALARLTPDRGRRIELVDMANAIRPMTWA